MTYNLELLLIIVIVIVYSVNKDIYLYFLTYHLQIHHSMFVRYFYSILISSNKITFITFITYHL